ncbi:MAG: type II secretion system F family protein, partial [Candidatus Saccharibacteria bacterium]|nr:type II secretion system F family protein [Candidatus Saccharibacteria bacterium]
MMTFSYRARNTNTNKIEKNTIQGNSEAAAARLLMAQGLVPLEMTPVGDKSGLLSSLRSHVSSKEVVIFTRQLSTMLNAGLP